MASTRGEAASAIAPNAAPFNSSRRFIEIPCDQDVRAPICRTTLPVCGNEYGKAGTRRVMAGCHIRSSGIRAGACLQATTALSPWMAVFLRLLQKQSHWIPGSDPADRPRNDEMMIGVMIGRPWTLSGRPNVHRIVQATEPPMPNYRKNPEAIARLTPLQYRVTQEA